ncbi:MAG: addiction module toxin RelE, partial [Bacteroidales bacterium]|nr:addiction module toxin RelE [Bacteroidales bacterium]
GSSMYKHRMSISSKGKGKSGGTRVITYNVKQTENDVVITLMTIYDKSEISNVSDSYLKSLVKEVTGK